MKPRKRSQTSTLAHLSWNAYVARQPTYFEVVSKDIVAVRSKNSTLTLSDDKIKARYPIVQSPSLNALRAVLICKTLTDAITRFVFD